MAKCDFIRRNTRKLIIICFVGCWSVGC